MGADLVLDWMARPCPSQMKVETNQEFIKEHEKLLLAFGTFAAFFFPDGREYMANSKSCQQYLNQQCSDLGVSVVNTDVSRCFVSTISTIFGLCSNAEYYITLNNSRKGKKNGPLSCRLMMKVINFI